MRVLMLAWAVTAAAGQDLFETRVRPVLTRQCYGCHGPNVQQSGLRVDSRENLLRGGKRGAALVPGSPEQSLLIHALRHEGLAMPPGTKLTGREVEAIAEWVRAGAVWPASAPAPQQPGWYDRAAQTHWSFQPVAPLAAGASLDQHWRAALRSKALAPAPPASPRAWIRRASFVLTGLPPTPEEIAAFERDGSYERVVDRLIASPHFGEHWARHWMDVVRYGETRGYEWNYEIVGAWRYRDYLIRAFNADVPYDQFVREHIAGDLLDRPRRADGRNESLAATAFYRLGEAGHDDCIQFRDISLDVVDNQIDTLSKAFLGMTVACARCHDHKLDPIPQADYRAAFAMLNASRAQTHTLDVPPAPPDPALKKRLRAELARLWLAADLRLPERGRGRVGFDDPLLPWLAMRNTADFATVWGDLVQRYRAERDARAKFNRANFVEMPLDAWSAQGLGLRRSSSGDFAVALRDGAALQTLLPAGLHTNAITNRWNGALRSPRLPKDNPYISLRLMGGGLAARRIVLDNCAIGEGYKLIENPQPHWVRLTTWHKQKELPEFVEVITKSDNPRIPDRPGMIKATPAELAAPESHFGVIRAVLHEVAATPREELTHLDRLFAVPVHSQAELLERYRSLARQAITAWARDAATDDDLRWLSSLLAAGVLPNSRDASPALQQTVEAYRKAEALLPVPQVIDGLGDSEGVQPRGFLSKIGPPLRPGPAGSGRRELAGWIASPQNPLTARVMVNRVWSHLFGRGLVRTVDNFGREGEPPANLQLLDHLAASFMRDGWSVKRLVRRIALSEAFRQSTGATSAADPSNALLHHYPLRRLPAESLRDAILAASGRLDRTMYGPSIAPARAEPQEYRRLFNGPLDGAGRRSLYTQITRMEGPRFLEIFDYPNPMAARGARDATNVPAQALALMNDPFVLQQAGVWAAALVKLPLAERVPAMFERALGRAPTAEEQDRLLSLAAQLARLQGVPLEHERVWKDVAHAVFNLKEFVYLP